MFRKVGSGPAALDKLRKDQHAHLDDPHDTYTGTVIYDEGNTWVHFERVGDVYLPDVDQDARTT